jgi:excisionase family DNA binding protein
MPRDRVETGETLGHGAGHGVVEPRVVSRTTRRAVDTQSSALPALLTLKQAAAHLAISYWTIRSWVDAGKLPAVRLPGDGRLVRVERAELERLIASSRG